MKKIILSLLFTTSIALSAQIGDSTQIGNSKWTFGGNAGISGGFGSNSGFGISVAPRVGYKISENVEVPKEEIEQIIAEKPVASHPSSVIGDTELETPIIDKKEKFYYNKKED